MYYFISKHCHDYFVSNHCINLYNPNIVKVMALKLTGLFVKVIKPHNMIPTPEVINL